MIPNPMNPVTCAMCPLGESDDTQHADQEESRLCRGSHVSPTHGDVAE